MAKSSVKVRDLGFKTVMKELSALGGIFVVVGVTGDQGDRREGVDQVLVASVHEFGSTDGTIPQRSFIRSTIDQRRNDIADVQQKALRRVADGKLTAEGAGGIAGAWVESAIKKKITDGDPGWKKLEASTIVRKGSSKPLIDTGQLRASITHKVIKSRTRPKGTI